MYRKEFECFNITYSYDAPRNSTVFVKAYMPCSMFYFYSKVNWICIPRNDFCEHFEINHFYDLNGWRISSKSLKYSISIEDLIDVPNASTMDALWYTIDDTRDMQSKYVIY